MTDMLLQSQNIFTYIMSDETEISSVYWWIFVSVLVILFIYFLWKTNKIINKENGKKQSVEPVIVQDKSVIDHEIHEEEAAAIAMALYLYKKELDRKEHFKTTLQRVSKVYSPWNSKIYTLRQNPR